MWYIIFILLVNGGVWAAEKLPDLEKKCSPLIDKVSSFPLYPDEAAASLPLYTGENLNKLHDDVMTSWVICGQQIECISSYKQGTEDGRSFLKSIFAGQLPEKGYESYYDFVNLHLNNFRKSCGVAAGKLMQAKTQLNNRNLAGAKLILEKIYLIILLQEGRFQSLPGYAKFDRAQYEVVNFKTHSPKSLLLKFSSYVYPISYAMDKINLSEEKVEEEQLKLVSIIELTNRGPKSELGSEIYERLLDLKRAQLTEKLFRQYTDEGFKNHKTSLWIDMDKQIEFFELQALFYQKFYLTVHSLLLKLGSLVNSKSLNAEQESIPTLTTIINLQTYFSGNKKYRKRLHKMILNQPSQAVLEKAPLAYKKEGSKSDEGSSTDVMDPDEISELKTSVKHENDKRRKNIQEDNTILDMCLTDQTYRRLVKSIQRITAEEVIKCFQGYIDYVQGLISGTPEGPREDQKDSHELETPE